MVSESLRMSSLLCLLAARKDTPRGIGNPYRVTPPRNPWYFGLSAFWFATSFKWFILFFLVPSLVEQIVPGGEKGTYWGMIVWIGATEAMVGPALMGWLSDRTTSRWGRRRPYLAVGAGMTAISMMVMSEAGSVAAFAIGYLLVQISDDVGTGPYSSAIPELVPLEKRGRASGSMALLQLSGQLAAVGFGLALKSSPQWIFGSIALVNLACAAVSIRSIRKLEAAAPEIQRPKALPSFASLWSPLKDRDFRWAWGTRFLNALGFYIVLNYLVYYLSDVVKVFEVGPLKLGSSFEAAIVLASVLALSGAFAAVVGGKRADRIGRKRVVVIAGWTMFVPLVVFCFTSSYAVLFPLAVMFGIGYGSYLSADWALVSDVLPDPDNPARDMGVWQMGVAAPQLLSGLMGWVIDQFNLQSAGQGYRVAFLFAGVATLLGSLLVTRIKGST